MDEAWTVIALVLRGVASTVSGACAVLDPKTGVPVRPTLVAAPSRA